MECGQGETSQGWSTQTPGMDLLIDLGLCCVFLCYDNILDMSSCYGQSYAVSQSG